MKFDNQNTILDEMRMLLPTVLNEMKKNDHLETWLSLNRMIHDGSFPFENIAFQLFMDVCRFLTCENTSSLRYSETIKHFWRIGYRLFHGKWLIFMSGPKHIGTHRERENERERKREFVPSPHTG